MFVHRRRRRGATAVLASVFALLLAACGGGAADTPSSSAPGTSGSATGGTTSSEPSENVAKPSGTVTWWSWNPSEADAAINIAEFNKEFPDIKVEYKFVEYSNYVNTVRLAATSDSGPDVFGLQVGVMANQFAPLTMDLKPKIEASLGADFADKITASDQFTIDGKLVDMPWMVTGAGLMFYNDGVLKQHSIQPPTTMAELKEACKKLEAAKVTCVAHGAKDNWVNIDVYQSIVNQLAPGKIYEAFKGDASFTDAEFVKSFEIWKSLRRRRVSQGLARPEPVPGRLEELRHRQGGVRVHGQLAELLHHPHQPRGHVEGVWGRQDQGLHPGAVVLPGRRGRRPDRRHVRWT